MFTSALEAVERQVAEVMVEVGGPPCDDRPANREPGTTLQGPRTPRARRRAGAEPLPGSGVRARQPEHSREPRAGDRGNAAKEFDYKEIDSIWQIPLKMHEVFSFMRENLVTQSDQREIEYAAIQRDALHAGPALLAAQARRLQGDEGADPRRVRRPRFVISMIEDKLTVRKVLKNTPAYKGGVKKGDVITQIDNDSTVSMDCRKRSIACAASPAPRSASTFRTRG